MGLKKNQSSQKKPERKRRASTPSIILPKTARASSSKMFFGSPIHEETAQFFPDTNNEFFPDTNGAKIKNNDDYKQEKSKDYKIINALIDHKLGINFIKKGEFPKYIIDAFNAFCKEKKVITLNLFYLDKNFKEFTDLIMHKIEVDPYKTANTPWQPNPYSNKNTLLPRLFEIFDNVNKLIIYSTKFDGFPSYSFSLMSLLSSIKFRSTFKEIVIKATWEEPTKEKGERSWLYTMWHHSPLSAVKAMLEESRCKISLRKQINNIGHWEDWLVIDRA